MQTRTVFAGLAVIVLFGFIFLLVTLATGQQNGDDTKKKAQIQQ